MASIPRVLIPHCSTLSRWLARLHPHFPNQRTVIAASLGPYGAALHNGAEYHGNYTCTFADLIQFHRRPNQRTRVCERAESPDILAFETLPSLAEAEAIGQALAPHPELAAWFAFTCVIEST